MTWNIDFTDKVIKELKHPSTAMVIFGAIIILICIPFGNHTGLRIGFLTFIFGGFMKIYSGFLTAIIKSFEEREFSTFYTILYTLLQSVGFVIILLIYAYFLNGIIQIF